MIKSKLIAFFLLICLAGRTTIAEDKVPEFTRVKIGESAPFTGYLFTPEAIARVVARGEEDLSRCKADCDSRIQTVRLDAAREAERSAAVIASKTRLVDDLTRMREEELKERDRKIQLLEADKVFGNFLIAGSFVAGIALTVGIVYVTGAVR